MIEHKITSHLQPTNTSCGYAALATLLSFYNKNITAEELLQEVKQPIDENGNPAGSITTELVVWCLEQGFKSDLYSFDGEMLDIAWQNLKQEELIEKITENRLSRDVLGLGQSYAKRYLDGYLSMMKAGGKLIVAPYVTTALIDRLLKNAPVYANVCSNVMNNKGRTKNEGLRKSEEDDKNGSLNTHSIVIYGKNASGNYFVADPWHGLRKLDAETLLCSVTMAQIECDNMVFQLSEK
jgi:hypothetical protein